MAHKPIKKRAGPCACGRVTKRKREGVKIVDGIKTIGLIPVCKLCSEKGEKHQ